jgi:hypothetical protein
VRRPRAIVASVLAVGVGVLVGMWAVSDGHDHAVVKHNGTVVSTSPPPGRASLEWPTYLVPTEGGRSKG